MRTENELARMAGHMFYHFGGIKPANGEHTAALLVHTEFETFIKHYTFIDIKI